MGGDGGDIGQPVETPAVKAAIDAGKWRSKRGLDRVVTALGGDDGLTRYVGGAVRDDLLQLEVSDIDLATRLSPSEVMDRLQSAGVKTVPTGIDHGTITAISQSVPFEVTTLRRDVSTDGRRATISFTDDWKEDAARRDFTLNALSADPASGDVYDYFGGLADLRRRLVKFIGDPLQRIAEDHLRILRFFRFHARFGAGDPDPAAFAACVRRANDLMALSRERVADELLKILGLEDPSATVQSMVEANILRPVLPEIGERGTQALKSLVASEKAAAIEPDPLRRLAALIGPDVAVAENIAARLRLSNKARRRLACAVSAGASESPRALAYRLGIECARDRLLLQGQSRPAESLEGMDLPKLPISGGDLIARGIDKGPEVARTLRRIEERWIELDFPTGADFDRLVAGVISATPTT